MLSETPWKRNRRSNKCLPTDEGLTNDNLCDLSLDPRVPDHGTGQKKTVVDHRLFVMEAVKRRHPEACAAILWKSAKASPKAAEKLKITAGELCKLQIADGIIPEPLGGAHADPYWTSQQIKTTIIETMDELEKMDTRELLKHRMLKFRKIGGFQEGIPIDPKKKVSMKKKENPIVQPGKTSNLELEGEVEKLKQQILKARESSGGPPKLGLDEMVDKLKREVDHEYSEAAKAMGLKDKITVLREEFAKAKNSEDQLMHLAVKVKIDKLMAEFSQSLSTAPNYASLRHKLGMLKEISEAKNFQEMDNKADSMKQEINKRFKQVIDQPHVKQKIEALKAEIENSGVSAVEDLDQGLKEKIVQLKEDIELEFADVLKSFGLHVYPPSLLDVKAKVGQFNEEIKMIMEDVINSSDLKNKIELLKMEAAKAGKTPDSESKGKIQALEQQIKQTLSEVMNSSVLKDRHDKLKGEISDALEFSGRSNGSLIKENHNDGNSTYGGSKVETKLEASRSFV
ncbi:unnamed protein product [Ilex paraguariensis]|uniref:acetyl-CoA carboxytransferase n=1 Tax=Ilex paraguariensis TaxID=185542 RepID=A0ABC8QT30_9AQUA